MSVTPRFATSTLSRIAATAAVAVLLAGAAAAPDAAHTTPRPGASCTMSGMTMLDHGKTYVCSKNAAGKAVWSRGLPVSASKLVATDTWAKAAPSAMSAAFGVLTNPTAKAIKVIGASSPYSPALQLHEVVSQDGAMVMQEKTGGFVIPAGGTLELKPGGNHIMFMSLTKPIKAGTMVPVTLIMSDGSRMTFRALAKVFTGANETYDPMAAG